MTLCAWTWLTIFIALLLGGGATRSMYSGNTSSSDIKDPKPKRVCSQPIGEAGGLNGLQSVSIGAKQSIRTMSSSHMARMAHFAYRKSNLIPSNVNLGGCVIVPHQMANFGSCLEAAHVRRHLAKLLHWHPYANLNQICPSP